MVAASKVGVAACRTEMAAGVGVVAAVIHGGDVVVEYVLCFGSGGLDVSMVVRAAHTDRVSIG